MDLSVAQLMKSNSYKVSKSLPKRKYARVLKVILPRKRTSKFRIIQNRNRNQDEDRYYIRVTHFNKLDFFNEINDNSKNEAIIASQLQMQNSLSNHSKYIPSDCTFVEAKDMSHTLADLTPPATPFEKPVTFVFNSTLPIPSTSSLVPPEALPLTPAILSCLSDVFNFQDHDVVQHDSITDHAYLKL